MHYKLRLKIKLTQIYKRSENESKRQRNNDGSVSTFSVVNHQYWNGSYYRDRNLMPPADVEHVIQEAQYCRNQK